MEPAKQVALFALTTLWVGAGGWALARKRFSARDSATLAVGFIAVGGAIAAAAALAAGWILLDYANAAAGVGLGAGTFVLLERRQRRAFWPRPRGAIHASMAIGASYLPVAAVWVVTLF